MTVNTNMNTPENLADYAALGGDNEKLKQFFQRVKTLMEEVEGLKNDLKDVFGEAKAAGYDPKLMKSAIAMHKKSEADRRDQDEMLPIYFAVLQKALAR